MGKFVGNFETLTAPRTETASSVPEGVAYMYQRADGTVEYAYSAAEVFVKCPVMAQMYEDNPEAAMMMLEMSAVAASDVPEKSKEDIFQSKETERPSGSFETAGKGNAEKSVINEKTASVFGGVIDTNDDLIDVSHSKKKDTKPKTSFFSKTKEKPSLKKQTTTKDGGADNRRSAAPAKERAETSKVPFVEKNNNQKPDKDTDVLPRFFKKAEPALRAEKKTERDERAQEKPATNNLKDRSEKSAVINDAADIAVPKHRPQPAETEPAKPKISEQKVETKSPGTLKNPQPTKEETPEKQSETTAPNDSLAEAGTDTKDVLQQDYADELSPKPKQEARSEATEQPAVSKVEIQTATEDVAADHSGKIENVEDVVETEPIETLPQKIDENASPQLQGLDLENPAEDTDSSEPLLTELKHEVQREMPETELTLPAPEITQTPVTETGRELELEADTDAPQPEPLPEEAIPKPHHQYDLHETYEQPDMLAQPEGMETNKVEEVEEIPSTSEQETEIKSEINDIIPELSTETEIISDEKPHEIETADTEQTIDDPGMFIIPNEEKAETAPILAPENTEIQTETDVDTDTAIEPAEYVEKQDIAPEVIDEPSASPLETEITETQEIEHDGIEQEDQELFSDTAVEEVIEGVSPDSPLPTFETTAADESSEVVTPTDSEAVEITESEAIETHEKIMTLISEEPAPPQMFDTPYTEKIVLLEPDKEVRIEKTEALPEKPTFETFAAAQPITEEPIALEAIIQYAKEEQPLEQTLVQLAKYIAETPEAVEIAEMPEHTETSLAPETFEEIPERNATIEEIIADVPTLLPASRTQEKLEAKSTITLELTAKILLLLKTLGYENPHETLVRMVDEYGLEFLLQALEQISNKQRKTHHQRLGEAAAGFMAQIINATKTAQPGKGFSLSANASNLKPFMLS